jgi:hypothetical protein
MTQTSNTKPVYLLDMDKVHGIEDVKVILSLMCIAFSEDHPAFDIAKEYCVPVNIETGETINETMA